MCGERDPSFDSENLHSKTEMDPEEVACCTSRKIRTPSPPPKKKTGPFHSITFTTSAEMLKISPFLVKSKS